MDRELPTPTPELVRAACKKFDRDDLYDQALKELFNQYPTNSDLRFVLLKVAALNSLYHTQILAIESVARHIHEMGRELDTALSTGSRDIVDKIARVVIGGKERNNYCFATKYCSWHNPIAYPIWDQNVEECLWQYKKQYPTGEYEFRRQDLWNYPKFFDIMVAFRKQYGLDAFTFKELDKFLYQYGGKTPYVDDSPISDGDIR